MTFVLIYGRNGWRLDLMRRGEQTTPGSMELLLALSREYFKCDGADMVSLGLSFLEGLADANLQCFSLAPLGMSGICPQAGLISCCVEWIVRSYVLHKFDTFPGSKSKSPQRSRL